MESIDFHGLPAVRWQASGATAVATLQGAQLVSWIPAGGEECLYVSERSAFARGSPLRGGVPVVFPQFGERGPLAHHGFARTRDWRAGRQEKGRVVFTLESSGETRALWPHDFALSLEIEVDGPRLDLDFRVRNGGSAELSFNAALHTYFRISDSERVRLDGLKGARFVDRAVSGTGVETREFVTADRAIDRVYLSPPAETRIEDGHRWLAISHRGFPDTVVWNPGSDGAKADMPPDGYRRMLCVEAAAFEHAIFLAPGNEWAGGQSIMASANR